MAMLEQYQPLFLKYRPQAISELVGQNAVAGTLTNAIKYGRVSHAYLLTGPRGTGKTSTARIFAKSLNCELGPTSEPCQTCTSCVEIKQGISPAVFEIDAASNNSVDDARLLIERAPLSACGGRFKLYIIDECHMLTKEAFNALLKTIEEPPANVIFILATTEEHKVLPTIVSRCQKLIFRLINEQAMTAHLKDIAAKENIILEPEAVTAIVRRANGGLRDALSLLDQISLLGVNDQAISTQDIFLMTGALPEDSLLSLSNHIFKGEGRQVLALLQELLASGWEAHLIASELAKHMLNVSKAGYLQSNSNESMASEISHYIAGSEKYKKGLVELAGLVDQSQLIQMVEEIDRLEVSCRRSAQPIMNLEIGLLSLCQRLDIVDLRTIQSRLQKLEAALVGGLDLTKNNQLLKSTPGDSKPKVERQEAKAEKPASAKEIIKPIIESQPSGPANLADNLALSPANVSSANDSGSLKSENLQRTNNVGSGNIDIAWQNILSELQRRHLPTFSLVSTHAFPIDLTIDMLTIGVFVDNFQKMIENKSEYIKAAAAVCHLGKDLAIRVKVQAGGNNSGSTTKGQKATILDNSPNNSDEQSMMSTTVDSESAKSQSSGNAARFSIRSAVEEKKDEGAAKEAYKLFEGPGSRYIAPSQ